ncbi:killer toxin sensitivity protein (Iki1), putative [Metarhizium acridum CQMa 102]|uniref:Elongator complex protein 5 n=1 Tax=Metarhizium acridum (strain CQMa 102) TaxID=655827 RepID=E9EA21_METAQ|nr:killer toxin sensitivity protein (Iki1), putative [Metarhizium acridum CQMa 102]EFY87271.1 killer toxin sensitivity protein (Iki1), putative [Metarhizium acridum CQMa 102]
MAAESSVHNRSHSLLLLQKLLNLRDSASPLTLVHDGLEQPAQPVLDEFTTRAKISKTKVILLSFATVKKPQTVDAMVKAAGRDLRLVAKELAAQYPAFDPTQPREKLSQSRQNYNEHCRASGQNRGGLTPKAGAIVLIDSLNSLASTAPSSLSHFLSSILTPAVSIVSVYHTDVPILVPPSFNEYEPHPFTILNHLATAILRLSSLPQEIDRQKARNRAVQEPEWGLKEEREGVIIGLKPRTPDQDRGVVIDMELRRKSGRTVTEKFILQRHMLAAGKSGTGRIALLTDHAMFSPAEPDRADEEEPESTFSLGLTEKQRRDREGIVLPYFDAQTDIGAGEGGRILYEMGREDDFDDEEDEI